MDEDGNDLAIIYRQLNLIWYTAAVGPLFISSRYICYMAISSSGGLYTRGVMFLLNNVF